MALKKIYVSRSAVENNNHTGTTVENVFLVRDGQSEHRSNSVILLGPCEIKYDPDAAEGSRIWIETYDKVIIKYEGDNQSAGPRLVSV